MNLTVQGADAGGRLPQRNCGYRNCTAARAGRIAPLTQSAIAVSGDGRHWAPINTSPAISIQFAATLARLFAVPDKVALDRADTAEKQDAAAASLIFETDEFWTQIDALQAAYVLCIGIPPEALQPNEGLQESAA